MALTIEDGSIVAGADSWATRVEFCAHAAARGVTVEDDDDADEKLRIAFGYIDNFENSLKGFRTNGANRPAYPRHSYEINGFQYTSDVIPQEVKDCQMELALDQQNGIDIYNRKASKSTAIRRKKIAGAIEVEYATNDSSQISHKSRSRYLLAKLKRRGTGGLTVGVALG